MNLILIYITHPNLKTAKKIAAAMLKKRLIACSNIFPVQSSYLEKGKIKNSKEFVSILKTKAKNWGKVKAEATSLHPYSTPCIIKIDAKANKEYESWIAKITQQP